MRIFESDIKINFVDENDVLVGFDRYDLCCENFGFFFSNDIPGDIECIPNENRPDNLDDLRFDPDFFEESHCGRLFDEGSSVTFKLNGQNRQVFLTLYNAHNGYYSHGFTISVKGKVIKDGRI